ncbi:MAG: hypothetical protein ACK5AS_01950 [Bacteroidota bacterium]|jgi:hypothetical protein
MGTNPFTGKPAQPVDPRGFTGSSNKRNFFIVLFAIVFIPAIYFLRDELVDFVNSSDRDFTAAYLMGDPWNGKIVYSDNTRSEPIESIFRVYDTKTKERKEFARFRFGTDPYYFIYHVGENNIVLYDFLKYSATYDLASNTPPAVKQEKFDYQRSPENETVSDTSASATNVPNQPIKPKQNTKNYFYLNSGNTDPGSGMGISGSGEIEIDGTALKTMGIYDFADYGLKYSYWVYDWYANAEITDKKTGGNLVLVELTKGTNNFTKSFFALVDKENNKLLVNGYPDNTIKGAGYLNDYFMNCRRDGDDHILCLIRDKVLRVQISTCKIEEVATW